MNARGDTVLRADSQGALLDQVRELGAIYWGGGWPHPDGKDPQWYAFVELPDREPVQMELEI